MAGFATHSDLAMMQFDDLFGVGEADSGAITTTGALIKRIKNMLNITWGNPQAIIQYT
ncbi:hypothetical protein D3C73_796120 [compost metagenome]